MRENERQQYERQFLERLSNALGERGWQAVLEPRLGDLRPDALVTKTVSRSSLRLALRFEKHAVLGFSTSLIMCSGSIGC